MRLHKPLRKSRGVYTSYCPVCEEQVRVDIEDGSFDHEFGTEHVYGFSCSKCHEDLDEKNVDFIEWD